jgi:hypothetical protein
LLIIWTNIIGSEAVVEELVNTDKTLEELLDEKGEEPSLGRDDLPPDL